MGEFWYSDLVRWAKERLPAWQQDALRRLVVKPALSSEDVVELAAMALARYVADASAPTSCAIGGEISGEPSLLSVFTVPLPHPPVKFWVVVRFA